MTENISYQLIRLLNYFREEKHLGKNEIILYFYVVFIIHISLTIVLILVVNITFRAYSGVFRQESNPLSIPGSRLFLCFRISRIS